MDRLLPPQEVHHSRFRKCDLKADRPRRELAVDVATLMKITEGIWDPPNIAIDENVTVSASPDIIVTNRRVPPQSLKENAEKHDIFLKALVTCIQSSPNRAPWVSTSPRHPPIQRPHGRKNESNAINNRNGGDQPNDLRRPSYLAPRDQQDVLLPTRLQTQIVKKQQKFRANVTFSKTTSRATESRVPAAARVRRDSAIKKRRSSTASGVSDGEGKAPQYGKNRRASISNIPPNMRRRRSIAHSTMSEGRLEENLALAALVDNAICRNAFDPYLYAEELLRVLQKKPYERTNRDISRLYKFLRQLKFSRTLSDFVVSEISGVGLFVEMEKDRVVFRQGEEGTSWFVILAGAVNVMVANVNGGEDAQHVDNTIVAHLMEGDHFGASALLNERRRAATIMTTEHCLFLKVMKADYNQILKYIHEKEVKEKILLLKSAMPLLGEPQLTAVANVLTMRTVSNNGLVIKEGDPITELFIVKKGQCEAIKNHMVGGRRIHLLMDTLGPGKYFGEATILQNPAKTKPIPSPITLRAVGEVQLGVLQAHDSWSKLRGELPLTSLMQIDEEVVERKYWEYKDKRLWMKYKKQVLEGFMKERQTKVVKKGS